MTQHSHLTWVFVAATRKLEMSVSFIEVGQRCSSLSNKNNVFLVKLLGDNPPYPVSSGKLVLWNIAI